MKKFPERQLPRGAFTIIELLAVVTIMGLLLSIGGGALVGSKVGKDAETTLQELRARLDNARWQAMTLRTRSRLVIAVSSPPALTDRLGRDPALSSYATALWNSDLQLWEVISAWHALPEGFGFITADSPNDLGGDWNASPGGLGVLADSGVVSTTIDIDRDRQLTAADEFEAAWIEFLPDGSVEPASSGNGFASFWTIAIAHGEITAPGTFQPRQASGIRPLRVDSQTGLITSRP